MSGSLNIPLLAYVGPETMLPLASVLAAVLGGLLLCWKWVVSSVRSFFGFLFRGGRRDDADPAQQVPSTPE